MHLGTEIYIYMHALCTIILSMKLFTNLQTLNNIYYCALISFALPDTPIKLQVAMLLLLLLRIKSSFTGNSVFCWEPLV